MCLMVAMALLAAGAIVSSVGVTATSRGDDGLVLETVYFPSVGRQQMAGCTAIESTDEDADGWVDRLSSRTYDARGNLMHVAVDNGVDGSIDQTVVNSYDDKMKLVRTVELDANGIASSVVEYQYNTAGFLIEEMYDYTADGVADFATYYAYDSGYRLTMRANDAKADGSHDAVYFYTYDGIGRRVRDDSDENGDGLLDGHVLYSWTGLFLAGAEGYDGGEMIFYSEYDYSDSGRVSERRSYNALTGRISSRSNWRRDWLGRVVFGQYFRDGEWESTERRSYSHRSRLQELTVSSRYNGVISSTYEYECTGE